MPATTAVPGATSNELAQLFGCTTKQIENLAKAGIVVRLAHGRYNAARSTFNYITHLREQASGRVGLDPSKDSVGANVKKADAHTRLLELRIRKEAGEVVDVADVRETWSAAVRVLRQFVLALPGRIAFEVSTLSARDKLVMERICRDGLEDMALSRGLMTEGRELLAVDVPQ